MKKDKDFFIVIGIYVYMYSFPQPEDLKHGLFYIVIYWTFSYGFGLAALWLIYSVKLFQRWLGNVSRENRAVWTLF